MRRDCFSSGMNTVDVTVVIIQKRDRILRITRWRKLISIFELGTKLSTRAG
jgi:hypothetical protein